MAGSRGGFSHISVQDFHSGGCHFVRALTNWKGEAVVLDLPSKAALLVRGADCFSPVFPLAWRAQTTHAFSSVSDAPVGPIAMEREAGSIPARHGREPLRRLHREGSVMGASPETVHPAVVDHLLQEDGKLSCCCEFGLKTIAARKGRKSI